MNLSTLSRALLLGTAVAASPLMQQVSAQSNVPKATMLVPFDFNFGPSHLPAGRYTVTSEGQHLARVAGKSALGSSIVMPFRNDSPDERGRAVFVRVGDRYCLKDLWIPGYDSHLHLAVRKPRHLPTLARTEDTQPQNVEVALLELPR